jgi:membrane protein implicated in regulation of membrane protease activity
MQMLTDLWGLSLNQTVILIAIILVLLDIFVPSEIPTHIAYVLVSGLLAINIDAHALVRIIIALLTWFSLVAFHYFIWRSFVQKLVNQVIAPDRFKGGAEGVIGAVGVIRVIEGNVMARVSGDLWPCFCSEDWVDGESVKVVCEKDGVLEVKKLINQ